MRASPALHHALCLALLVALTAPAASAGDASRGHAFEFLRLPAEPVGRSLAGAHVASVYGPASLAWNPAGLGEDSPSAAVLAHASWSAGLAWEWGALSLRAGSGSFGVACGVLRGGELDGYDADGRSTGSFAPQQAYASLGYGRALGERLSAGVTVEGLLSGDGRDAPERGWALGGGVLVHLGRTSLALAAQHWAPALRRGGESYPLPGTVRAGASFSLPGRTRLHTAAEWIADEGVTARVGAEWQATEGVAALAGACLTPGTDAALQPTAGLAVDLGRLRVAYGYQPAASLDASHQLSLTVLLGASR
jgi:hypothetical protein